MSTAEQVNTESQNEGIEIIRGFNSRLGLWQYRTGFPSGETALICDAPEDEVRLFALHLWDTHGHQNNQ